MTDEIMQFKFISLTLTDDGHQELVVAERVAQIEVAVDSKSIPSLEVGLGPKSQITNCTENTQPSPSFKQENKAQCSLVGLFNLLSFIGAIDIIGISKNRQYIKVLEIIGVFGSALPLLSQHEVRCAAEGDVKGEDEAEDEREGAEEDGAVVGVQVGMQGRG